MLVRDVMSESPVVVHARARLSEAAELLAGHTVRHLPVVEAGALVGMLSDRDLRSVMSPRLLDEASLDELRSRYDAPVSEVMSPDVTTVHPETDLSESIDRMLDLKVGALPVVDPGTGELQGIVSYVDLLRALREKA